MITQMAQSYALINSKIFRRKYLSQHFFQRWIAAALLLVLLSINLSVTYADTFFDEYYGSEGLVVDMTKEEETRINNLISRIMTESENSVVRAGIEHESIEYQYENYLFMVNDGFEPPEEYYDDIGLYKWILGIPTEECVSDHEAWKIAIEYLLSIQVPESEILHYYPMFSFLMFDVENPIWRITFLSHDQHSSKIYEVALYALDGNIMGFVVRESVG